MISKNNSMFIRNVSRDTLLESQRLLLHPVPAHELTDNDKSQWYRIIEKKNHAVVGSIGMVHCRPEWHSTGVHVTIQEEKNRRVGYALEALELLEQYVFGTLSYQRIAVSIVDFNKAAIGLFKKAGFKLEGVQEQGFYYNNRYYDFILLRLLRHEYFK